MNKDNDPKHWKLGIFYYNPDNPSEVVDRRKGIGTTINFASKVGRRMIYVLFAFPIIIITVFIIAGLLSR